MRTVTKALVLVLTLGACGDDNNNDIDDLPDGQPIPEPGVARSCRRVDLASDTATLAPIVNPDLVDSWGLERGVSSFVIANNGSNKIAALTGNGVATNEGRMPSGSLTIGGGITGLVATRSARFLMQATNANGQHLAADYIVVNMAGQVIGISTAVAGGLAEVLFDSHGASQYMGVAILPDPLRGDADVILAADFKNKRIDRFDTSFTQLNSGTVFILPSEGTVFDADGFSPFNVAVLNGRVFVSFAQQATPVPKPGETTIDEVHGPGLGVVAEFSPAGDFVQRIATGGDLDAPWGMTLAPVGFCSNVPITTGNNNGNNTDTDDNTDAGTTVTTTEQLLVGNLGNGLLVPVDIGTVTAFVPDSTTPVTVVTAPVVMNPLRDSSDTVIAIDGLWGIKFGNGTVGLADSLYFAAGPDNETHGLFGRLETVETTVAAAH